MVDYNAGVAAKDEGSATTFPFGASILYRPTVSGPTEITLEGGFRYVFVNSDIDITATDGYYIYKDNVEIDDGLVGLIGADIAYPLSPKVKLGFGAGYQFDISKGKATWFGVDLGDNEMKGFYLRLGLNVKI